jgi:hypothetical protein
MSGSFLGRDDVSLMHLDQAGTLVGSAIDRD